MLKVPDQRAEEAKGSALWHSRGTMPKGAVPSDSTSGFQRREQEPSREESGGKRNCSIANG